MQERVAQIDYCGRGHRVASVVCGRLIGFVELIKTLCKQLRQICVRGDLAKQVHAFANHLRVQPDVRIHLIEVPHVSVTDIVYFRVALSWALGLRRGATRGRAALTLPKHRTYEVVYSTRYQISDTFLIADCVKHSFCCLRTRHLLLASLPFLHSKNPVCKRFFSLSVGPPLKNDGIGLLLSHRIDFILLLFFFGLLAYFEEVRIKDLVGVERVRVGIIVLIITLVHPFQLVVPLRNPCN